MDAVTTAFLGIGGFGVLVLALSLVFGEFLHLGHAFHVDADGPLSLPAIAGFLGAFGFGGAIAAELTPGPDGLGLLAACVVGFAAAVPTGWLAIRLSRAAMNMRTDKTLNRTDLVGATGIVISPVPADGYGVVKIRVAGQQLNLSARCGAPLAVGTAVLVIEAPSDTSVIVEENTLPLLPNIG